MAPKSPGENPLGYQGLRCALQRSNRPNLAEVTIPNEHFIDVPRATQTSLASFEVASIVWPKLRTPLTDRFIGDRDFTFGEKFFHLSETEAEPMVQPDGVPDNFRGKTKTAVAERFGIHHVSLPKPAQLDNILKMAK